MKIDIAKWLQKNIRLTVLSATFILILITMSYAHEAQEKEILALKAKIENIRNVYTELKSREQKKKLRSTLENDPETASLFKNNAGITKLSVNP